MKYISKPAGNRDRGTAKRLAYGLMALVAASSLTSCATTGATTGVSDGSIAGRLTPTQLNNPQVKARNAVIATEAPGNYYIGRRWWTDGTRFWGYLRQPGQPWSEAKLTIMNESIVKTPDRTQEEGVGQPHGFDHNFEYRIWGSYTGKMIYDPNSNFKLPEFRLSKFELVNQSPGFLFYPGEPYNPRQLPSVHPLFP